MEKGKGGRTAFILAGGKSSRMGTDKAFLSFDGETLLSRILQTAGTVADSVRIVGDKEKFATYSNVIEDVYRKCGPLGGIHAALSESSSELNLMIAVDMPFVSPELLAYLFERAASSGEIAVVPRVCGRLQPLCAVYRREFAGYAETALRAGRNKIEDSLQGLAVRYVEQEELLEAGFSPLSFRNLNTLEEFEAGAAWQDAKKVKSLE